MTNDEMKQQAGPNIICIVEDQNGNALFPIPIRGHPELEYYIDSNGHIEFPIQKERCQVIADLGNTGERYHDCDSRR